MRHVQLLSSIAWVAAPSLGAEDESSSSSVLVVLRPFRQCVVSRPRHRVADSDSEGIHIHASRLLQFCASQLSSSFSPSFCMGAGASGSTIRGQPARTTSSRGGCTLSFDRPLSSSPLLSHPPSHHVPLRRGGAHAAAPQTTTAARTRRGSTNSNAITTARRIRRIAAFSSSSLRRACLLLTPSSPSSIFAAACSAPQYFQQLQTDMSCSCGFAAASNRPCIERKQDKQHGEKTPQGPDARARCCGRGREHLGGR